MTMVFSISYHLFCLWSLMQVVKGEYCDYFDDDHGINNSTYCYYGCCNTSSNATLRNVCCSIYDGPGFFNCYSSNTSFPFGIIVAVSFIFVMFIVTCCCCCRKRQATQGLVLEAPVVYSSI